MIKVRNLTKKFGEKLVLDHIDVDVQTGQVVVIIGPSGSGKSTFLRCLNLLEKPNTGIIEINDVKLDSQQYKSRDVYQLRQQTAMVFQQYNLFKNKTALQNVIEALIVNKKMKKAEAISIGETLLQRVGLEKQANQYPITLSGGQQQRISIARALAVKPNAILFDEPTSALDPELVNDVLQVIRELAEEDITMVIVTHEMKFAKEVADHVIFMADGHIVEQGPPEQVFEHSLNPRTRKFLKQMENVGGA
jgi:putative S-methylcysteine transport system ATP-binding protein